MRLERAAAEQLLASGRIDEGAVVLRRVLVATGTKAPRTPLGAIVCLLFYRVLRALRRPEIRATRQTPSRGRIALKIDALHSFVVGFSIVDVVLATCMQARHLLLALRADNSVDVMRAASIELTQSRAWAVRSASASARSIRIVLGSPSGSTTPSRSRSSAPPAA